MNKATDKNSEIKEYVAHSVNEKGEIQTMGEHSLGVAQIMKGFTLSEVFKDLYEFCGTIHDIGKYSDDFQQYINGDHIQSKHSIYGAIFAMDKKHMEIAFPVYGHHAGLPDSPEMQQSIKAELHNNVEYYNSICNKFLADAKRNIAIPKSDSFFEISDILQQELFVRMLYSALIDADSLDTERHFNINKFESRKKITLDSNLMLFKLNKLLESFNNNTEKNKLEINKLREDVRKYAESKANLPQGCFSLTLPTGLGKTICSINWALHHARHHDNIKRIIIVLPFISIIDQTAEILKNIFDDKEQSYVLEHHSNVIYIDDEENDKYNPKQLAIENWDYPIIVTTSVQFFESLFSNRRSKCRKLHNIQDSIIIFDEIQTLPFNVTEPSLIMLENLQQLCRCSILFCTATQPDFESREGFCGMKHIEPLVENPKHIFEQTKRVSYHPINEYKEIEISELADDVTRNNQSALVVFNTKKKARMFFKEIENNRQYTLFHLSTSMCPVHRKEIIGEIKHSLSLRKQIIVSSTQLIEAGVDLDFPTVYRELAPLESIIQSAGRCNREGKMKDKKGDVYLFSLAESGQPSLQYRSWSEFANLLYKGNEARLYTHDFYSFYYRELVKNFVNTDKLRITNDRKKLLYQTVAEKYKIMDNNTHSLFVYKYNEKSIELYNHIKNQEFLTKQESQQVAQYSVQVYDKFMKDNSSFIGLEQCGILVWYGPYSTIFGLQSKDNFNTIII